MTSAVETQTAALERDLARARTRFEAIVTRAANGEAFSKQPPAGGWSAGQCIDHLNKTNAVYLPALQRAVGSAPRRQPPVTGEIRSTLFGRLFMRVVGEEVKSKAKAPGKAVPHATLDRDRVIADFRRGLDDIQRTLADASAIDVNRAAFASPFFKLSRVRVGTGLRITIGHLHRHLGQAERALTANGL